MGSFYTNHTLRGPSQRDVLAALKGRSALVSRSENGCVTVLDEACESQDGHALAELAQQLSSKFDCPVLAVLNHDDDVLYFELYEHGVKTDEYNSAPGYFDDSDENEPAGGDSSRLAAAFGASDPAKIEAALRGVEYVFAMKRHQDLAKALGLPNCSVGIGYAYASAGDLPPGVPQDSYVHTEG
jgi:hypothetical protein